MDPMTAIKHFKFFKESYIFKAKACAIDLALNITSERHFKNFIIFSDSLFCLNVTKK